MPLFLDETVRITFDLFKEKAKQKIKAIPDYYDCSEDSSFLLCILSKDEIEVKATSGKVSFDALYGDTSVNLLDAQNNAIQCFKEGMVALFVDDVRYEDIYEIILLHDGSEVSFVKMSFLAGRMW